MTGAAGLFGAALSLIYLWMAAASPDRLRSAAKTGSVLALALAAVLGGAPGVAVAGLCAAAMGDLALSRAGERAFRIGVLWFCLAQITDIAVHPERQRQGLGREVMEGLMSWAEASLPEGCYISLIADPGAEHLYRRFGFAERFGMARSV